ncbi:MAG TPA: LysM peptidoglycan-binding domain-containing protein [Segeticoccus sp.]|uniref:LysM peptidoglycan-binding domain-containing protein n=1 Tax=Segeticoccus sp. TaxID=2706531 RepID=UPI002D807C07|nr:LysM peptidoglycan-binding domain-containing protein [Segeticoccus sp.]HET8601211.1 LysM peptidoglycan-binding domain-containing protein [Segeticoccus sp.]
MAAATWEQLTDFGMPGRTDGSSALSPSRDRRAATPGRRRGRHLRLVPTGPDAQPRITPPARRAPERAARPRVIAQEQSVRITRRGRLAVTLLVTAAVITLAATMWSAGAPAVPTIDHTTTVAPGQTLSQIATEQMPGVPMQQAVNQLQLTNNLSSADVHAGQVLQIPTMP